MQLAMEIGGENEVGVWVSGFYGSGKTSFTKYLGLALDQNVQIEGMRFLKYLQDRMRKPQTRALLATVASRFPAAVVLLDLASEMLAGATMEEVSTVLYYKVLQWAGYSRNLKVAAFERRLKKDGRYEEFTARIQAESGRRLEGCPKRSPGDRQPDPRNRPRDVPGPVQDASAFTTETTDFVRFENERVKEMIDIVREATGKEYIVFIIDEVGQYVGSRPNLILNLDGLAKNLKAIGGGKVWIMGTAQQTLTEDDPQSLAQFTRTVQTQRSLPHPDRPGIQRHQGDLLPPSAGQIPTRRKGRWATCLKSTARSCASIPGCRMPNITMPTLTRPRSSTCIPSCRRTSTSCCTCWAHWPNPPAASACARRSRSSRIS